MSDTPRTDAALEWVRPVGNDSGPPHEQYVSAEFARQLERENAALRAALQKSCDEDRALHGGCILLVELREDKARMDWLEEHPVTQTESALAEWYGGKKTFRSAIDAAMHGPQSGAPSNA